MGLAGGVATDLSASNKHAVNLAKTARRRKMLGSLYGTTLAIFEKVDFYSRRIQPINATPLKRANWHVPDETPLNVLQKLGGWSDYKMVLRYAHLAPEHLAEHANRLNGIVAKSVAPDNVTN